MRTYSSCTHVCWNDRTADGHRVLLTRTHRELDLTDNAVVDAVFAAERPTQVYLVATKVGGIHANDTYPPEFIYQDPMIEAKVIDAAWRPVLPAPRSPHATACPNPGQQPSRRGSATLGVADR